MPTNRQNTSDFGCQPGFPGDISTETFLHDYWQKKPLLVKNAFPHIQSPLTPNELAGLACEDDVNSRLVIEQHKQGPWHVVHGPLNEDDFNELPATHWTLLVTDVDKHVPAARALIDRFRFIPDWRIDDLMISYAPEGGSVGPHSDAYDVFLIQALGQRRWMINSDFDETCLDDTELRILQHFDAAEDWVLDPGDMLYLPPNIAHYGIALNDCMTCSVGFRAPSVSNMISEYAEFIAAATDREQRYQDPDLAYQQNPAEIQRTVLTRIKTLLAMQLAIDDDKLLRWFGEFTSEPRSGLHTEPPETQYASFHELCTAFTLETRIAQAPVSKYLYARRQDQAWLFVDGKTYVTSPAFAAVLSGNRSLATRDVLASITDPADERVLLDLYNNGQLLIQ
ncbi:MAG: cupin domain-containing protein [Gammaproteobacteria bacterium]|nr:cupin domain-containing protein [Gammaproteobacteria bacterium]